MTESKIDSEAKARWLTAAEGGFPSHHAESHWQEHFKWQSGLQLMIKWSAGEAFLSFFRERELFLKAKVNAVIERTLIHSHVKMAM